MTWFCTHFEGVRLAIRSGLCQDFFPILDPCHQSYRYHVYLRTRIDAEPSTRTNAHVQNGKCCRRQLISWALKTYQSAKWSTLTFVDIDADAKTVTAYSVQAEKPPLCRCDWQSTQRVFHRKELRREITLGYKQTVMAARSFCSRTLLIFLVTLPTCGLFPGAAYLKIFLKIS